jgi:uncharacterized protein (TIGR02246 family)
MSKVLPVLMVWLCGAAHGQEQKSSQPANPIAPVTCPVAADRQALEAIAESWKDGYNTGDAAKVASLYAENAYYLTQHFAGGIVHGRARIQAYVQNGIDARYHVDEIRIVASNCSDDLAYTVGTYQSTNAGQKAFGINLVVLRKLGGRWLIVAHEAAVPDAGAIRSLGQLSKD